MSELIKSSIDLKTLEREERLARMRHSAAHVLAEAMINLIPEAELGFGPPTDTGFYYDFRLPRALTNGDLAALERTMKRSIKRKHRFVMERITRKEASIHWENQPFKLELLDELEDENITQCSHAGFIDLCRGGHVNTTGEIPAFKLISIAGAYWRGNEDNPQMQRVYGALFETKEELDRWEEQRKEAQKRDHRRLGRELELFAFSEDIGQGIPLFLPKGEKVRNLMESFVREQQERAGYQHVWTGHLVKRALYERSGHMQNYESSMFPPLTDGETEFFLKPMNCPSHMTLFNALAHSYRDLPLRYAEFATLYRYEKSGELSGLTRVRSLTQDDAHIFCLPEQVEEEFTNSLELIKHTLNTYGFSDYRVALSLPDNAGKYIDAPELWEEAINALRKAMESSGLEYVEEEGEAAFYGPKADFIAKDVLGREWQLSTIQVDFIQPGRLGCTYVGEDGQEHTPVMLHRAVTGSTERFLGVLIEHFNGAFPFWLSPIQVVIIPIADRHYEYASLIQKKLQDDGFRVEVDFRSERMGAKIRLAQLQKVPYMIIVGDKEAESSSVSVRVRGSSQTETQDLGEVQIADLIARLHREEDEKFLGP